MRFAGHASYLEKFWVRGEQAEDRQGRSGVATATHTAVVSQLGIGLSRDDLRDHEGCPKLSLGCDDVDRPAMMPIIAVEGGNQKSGVGERAQPPYTVSSIVSERSGGPWMTPTKLSRRST
jgi:hypothetical protein